MSNFKEGDVVELKSGGPDLSVARIWTNGTNTRMATVHWFDGAELKGADIAVDALKKSGASE